MPDKLKVFYGIFPHSDYGQDTLYDGLCKILGHENVYEYPQKHTLHGEEGRKYANFPCLYNYPIKRIYDDLIFKYLDEDFFDIIILTCNEIGLFTDYYSIPGMNFSKIISEKVSNKKIVFVDQGDHGVVRFDIMNYFPRCLGYFKRQYLKEEKYPENIHPLPFSYSREFFNFSTFSERTRKAYWSGGMISPLVNRREHVRLFENYLKEDFGNYVDQKVYKEELRNSKIGLNLYGCGYDTVRYFETPANGVMLLTQPNKNWLDNDLVDGESCVEFNNPREMIVKLEYYINNEKECEEIARNGYEKMLKYHTTEVRAQYFLDKVKALYGI